MLAAAKHHIFSASPHPLKIRGKFNNAQGGTKMSQKILRLPTVKSESGLSRSTIYLRIAQGQWTKPVNLGARAVGWPANEVSALNSARIAGKSNQEIRTLVVKLEAARKG